MYYYFFPLFDGTLSNFSFYFLSFLIFFSNRFWVLFIFLFFRLTFFSYGQLQKIVRTWKILKSHRKLWKRVFICGFTTFNDFFRLFTSVQRFVVVSMIFWYSFYAPPTKRRWILLFLFQSYTHLAWSAILKSSPNSFHLRTHFDFIILIQFSYQSKIITFSETYEGSFEVIFIGNRQKTSSNL